MVVSALEKRTTINETANVGRGHVPADREAAGSTNKQVCMQSIVPAPVGTCPQSTVTISFIVVRSRLFTDTENRLK